MIHVPLNKLVLSATNMRTNVADATAIDDLAASIAAHGLINPLTVVAKGKKHEVVAGGRRYRALCKLADDGKIADDFEVMVKPVDAADATEITIAENFLRTDPRPYEYYRAFAATGESDPAKLADRFGLEVKQVERVLRLGNLHPTVFDAYATGQIDNAEAKALGATADTDAQLSAFTAYSKLEGYNRSTWKLRELLGMATREHARLLELVGEEAYLAAGGKIERDLFSESVRIADTDLLEQLAVAKRTELVEAAIAEAPFPAIRITDKPTNYWGGIDWQAEVDVEDVETERPIGAHVDAEGRITFWYIDQAEPEPAAPDGEAGEVAADPEPTGPTASRLAVERMAMIRRERLIERTANDMMVHADALDMLAFIIHRSCFMGPRNYDVAGTSTLGPTAYQDADWHNEPDHAKAWALFRAADSKAVAAEMLGRMTVAKHAGEKSAYIDWLASMSAPKHWVSTPEFWTMFRKGQIFDMLGEVAPTWVEKHKGITQGELRRQAHRLCSSEVEAAVSGIPQAELDAATKWVPTWLRFADEGLNTGANQ
ncbi:MAG: ParB/RepB/Spo0J family partition protein [Novosphingobium sp.]|nr:ParB/RepB/Spo0J family partition protein [Novosphingobium sp.]